MEMSRLQNVGILSALEAIEYGRSFKSSPSYSFKKKITLTHTSTQHSENLLYLCWSKFMNHA